MVATALLSMWVSNTATAMMLLPIGLAIIDQAKINTKDENSNFGSILILSIAYAASIGGTRALDIKTTFLKALLGTEDQ